MNPYLQQSANNIATNLTQNWQQNALPSINSGAMMAGGFGGSRQGVAQALSANGLNQAIGQAQTGLYSNAYNTDQQLQAQRDMQQAQLASNQSIAGMQNQTQRDLGLGGLANQRYGMDQNFGLGVGGLLNQATANANQFTLGNRAADTAQFGAETSRGLGLGQLSQQGDMNTFNQQLAGFNAQLSGLNALQNWNNLGLGWANQQQQTPLQNLGQLAGIGANIGGQGGSVSTPYQGNPWLGAIGGGQLGSNLWSNLFKTTPGG